MRTGNSFNIKNSNLKPTFSRNGKNVYLDPIRKIFVEATPEEEVRQKFIEYLINELKVPKNMIDIEGAMCHYEAGVQGRADIIVKYFDKADDTIYPLFVVECKASTVLLIDKVYQQAVRYDEVLNSGNVFLTNGIDTEYFKWNKEDGEFEESKEIPDYYQILKKDNLVMKTEEDYGKWDRPEFKDNSSAKVIKHMLDYGWIGKGTEETNLPFFSNLNSLLMDERDSINLPFSYADFTIIKEGIRYTEFGNAAGGKWPGLYRYFIINDKNGNNQIVSITLMSKCYKNEDPKFPNANGHTMLLVAVDDYKSSHNSLQLDMDKFTSLGLNKRIVYHDGTLTAGKKGRVKNAVVMNYIKENGDNLIKGDKVHLGSLPIDRNISWVDAKEFIGNCIQYALLRDELRVVLKG